MARQKGEASKSEQIRKYLKANPRSRVKDVVAALGEQGVSITPNLVYYIKGRMRGRGKKRNVAAESASTAAAAVNGDALKTILKVKAWAVEVGGMKKLKGIVEALCD